MEPGLLLAAGGPQAIITGLCSHLFMTDCAGGLNALQEALWNLLDGPMVDAEGLENSKVLVEHARLGTTGEVVGPLALDVAAANCSPCCTTLVALEPQTPPDFFQDVFREETEDAFFFITLLLQTRGEKEAVVVGGELAISIEFPKDELIILFSGAEDAATLLCPWQLLHKFSFHFPEFRYVDDYGVSITIKSRNKLIHYLSGLFI